MANTTRQRPTIPTDLLAVLGGLAVLGLLIARNRLFFHDDAYISLRYAVNLAETGRLQWNPGEWVEGYTSLLHVALSALVIRLGAAPVLAVHLVNAAAAAALLAFTAMAARRLAPGDDMRAARALTVLAVAASAPVAVWVLGGLEAVLVAALLTGGLTALLASFDRPGWARPALAAAAFSAAILTRLDSAVFIAGAGLGLALAAPGPGRRRTLAAATVVAIPAVVALAQMAVRLQVYGEVFPLTFYAKTELPVLHRLSSGLPYLGTSPAEVPVLAVAAIAVLLGLGLHRLSRPALLILAAIGLHLAYVVWVGGDHMPAKRMLVSLIAPAALFVLAVARALDAPLRLAVVILAPVVALWAAFTAPPRQVDAAAFTGEIVGRHIDEHWPTGLTIALNTAGSTPFYASEGRRFIDMLGLNDPVIARREDVPMLTVRQAVPGHSKGDGAYVLSRAPDRIIVGPAEGVDVAEAWFLTGAELARMPEFARCYEKAVEQAGYSEAVAARGPARPNPLLLTFYRRICP